MATLPPHLEIDVTESCEYYPPDPLTERLANVMTHKYVCELARDVWGHMGAEPALFALNPDAIQRFMQSEEKSFLTVDFREMTRPSPIRSRHSGVLVAGASVSDAPPSVTSDLVEGRDSGMMCTICFRQGDCAMFVRSAIIHELTHAMRRLSYWRSHVLPDSTETPNATRVPTVAPFTHSASARPALVAALKARGLWGLMLLDDAAADSYWGLHSGYVIEHLMHGGIVVSLLSEPQGLSNTDGSVPATQAPFHFALVQTRTLQGPPAEFMALWEGRPVQMRDVDIDQVKARPLLRWQAWRNAVRMRNACCAGGSPSVRSCPRSELQLFGAPEVRPGDKFGIDRS